LGVDRYLIAATLAGVVSQRLVRRLCPECGVPRAASEAERALLAPLLPHGSRIAIKQAQGCARCRNSGRAGRVAVGEGFLVDETIRAAIAGDASGARLLAALSARGFAPLTCAAAMEAAAGRIAPADIQALSLA